VRIIFSLNNFAKSSTRSRLASSAGIRRMAARMGHAYDVRGTGWGRSIRYAIVMLCPSQFHAAVLPCLAIRYCQANGQAGQNSWRAETVLISTIHIGNIAYLRAYACAFRCMHVGMRAPPCSNNAPTSSMPATDRAWLISLACLRPAGRPRAACSPRRPLSSSIGSHEPRRACERWEARWDVLHGGLVR